MTYSCLITNFLYFSFIFLSFLSQIQYCTAPKIAFLLFFFILNTMLIFFLFTRYLIPFLSCILVFPLFKFNYIFSPLLQKAIIRRYSLTPCMNNFLLHPSLLTFPITRFWLVREQERGRDRDGRMLQVRPRVIIYLQHRNCPFSVIPHFIRRVLLIYCMSTTVPSLILYHW